jgi:hypothetical protein
MEDRRQGAGSPSASAAGNAGQIPPSFPEGKRSCRQGSLRRPPALVLPSQGATLRRFAVLDTEAKSDRFEKRKRAEFRGVRRLSQADDRSPGAEGLE